MQVRNKIRVVIADRDLFYLQKLKLCLERRGDMVVVGMADNGPAVFQMVQEGAPDVLLMDEPTSALDPGSTLKIEDLMADLKKDYTVVIVTHNMQQASRISDKTAFFLLGQLIEYGTTKQIFGNPKEKQTEDYITGRFG